MSECSELTQNERFLKKRDIMAQNDGKRSAEGENACPDRSFQGNNEVKWKKCLEIKVG